MVKKKSELDLDYKPPKWKPGEAVAVLMNCDGKSYLVGGYEIFNEDKERCLTAGKRGFAPIKLASNKKAVRGQLLIVHKGQNGSPVRYSENQVFKLSDIPKDKVYSFEEVFGCAGGITVVAGSYFQSEQEDLNFGIAPVVEEVIEECDEA